MLPRDEIGGQDLMGTLTKLLAIAATLMLGMSTLAAAEVAGKATGKPASKAASKATTKATEQESGDEGGLAGLHAQAREGRYICMTEHSHHGASAGHPTKKVAEAEAAQSWSSFTAFEYGAAWGDYAIAAGKDMQCSQSDSGSWGCEVGARPCKRTKEQKKRAASVKTD
jgi:hypothetical protein